MRVRIIFTLAISLFLLAGASASAEELKAAIGQIAPQGITQLTNLYTAIAEATGNTITITVVPTARGMYMVANGQVDFYGPVSASKDPKKVAALDYDYSTAVTHETPLVLYVNKNKPISVDALKNGNKEKYNIETLLSLVEFFPFAAQPSTNAEASFKKVDSGAIDGFLYTQSTADAALKKLELKNIKRVLFDYSQGVFAIKKGGKGGHIDSILSKGIEILKANGKYFTILSEMLGPGSKYSDWQP
jgi:polar amino acid transport system substrate-binding protein